MEAIDVYRNIQALSAEFATERRERQRRRELVRQCYTCRSVTSPVIEPGKNSPKLLEGPTLINTPPGMEATIDHGTPTDDNEGYCVFQVSGTSNRDDVRAVQNAVLAGTRSVDGGQTFFPFFITRVLEAR
jgi:hypothetical protein